MWVFLNNRWLTREDARVSIFDHGFLYGDGIYETLRTYDGRLFMWDAHLARFHRSADAIGLTIPIPDKDWPGLIHEALERNALRNAYIRITVSRGEGEIGLDPALCSQPTCVIIAKPLPSYPESWFQDGVTLKIASVRRNLAAAVPPHVKSLNFLNNILAKREATAGGAVDAIMLNAHGELTECTASNIFLVRSGRLCTPAPACGLLEGITRRVILQLAGEAGLPAEEGRYTADIVDQVDECFLTNTTMEVLPVRQVDRRALRSPGPVTSQLHNLFRFHLGRFLEPPDRP
jgi:branched-chain amino acid aminotransferase